MAVSSTERSLLLAYSHGILESPVRLQTERHPQGLVEQFHFERLFTTPEETSDIIGQLVAVFQGL